MDTAGAAVRAAAGPGLLLRRGAGGERRQPDHSHGAVPPPAGSKAGQSQLPRTGGTRILIFALLVGVYKLV